MRLLGTLVAKASFRRQGSLDHSYSAEGKDHNNRSEVRTRFLALQSISRTSNRCLLFFRTPTVGISTNMPKLSTWLRKRIQRARNQTDLALPPGLPVLPSKRPHVLTPSSSRTDLNLSGASGSTFFERLPPELRYKIYLHAFGNRTVHMDLRFDHPWVTGPLHAGTSGYGVNEPGHALDSIPPAWIWWSSVCHRHPIIPERCCEDTCRTGMTGTLCPLFPGVHPFKCFVGVMGWLLTCRQA